MLLIFFMHYVSRSPEVASYLYELWLCIILQMVKTSANFLQCVSKYLYQFYGNYLNSVSLLGIVVLRILPDQLLELQALNPNFMILYKVIQWWLPMVFFLKFSPSCQVSTIWASWKYRCLLHDGIRWLNGLIVPTYQLTWYQKVLITSNWKFYDDIWAIWISQDDAGRNVVCINGMPPHLHHLARYQELLIKVIWKWCPMIYYSI